MHCETDSIKTDLYALFKLKKKIRLRKVYQKYSYFLTYFVSFPFMETFYL